MDQVQGKQVHPDFRDQSVYAKVKHFRIEHPEFPELTLTHTCLEGPENAVFVRGYSSGSKWVEFPPYWESLVEHKSITVQLTPVGTEQLLYVKRVDADGFVVSGVEPCFFWIAFGTRKDVEPLQVIAVKKEEPTGKVSSILEKLRLFAWQVAMAMSH